MPTSGLNTTLTQGNSELLEAWKLLSKVNPKDPMAAARAYPRVMAALVHRE